MRQTGSAESTMNSAISSAADPAITNTFQQPADAVAFSITPVSRLASCRLHDQNIQPRGATQTARDVTEPSRPSHLLRLVHAPIDQEVGRTFSDRRANS